VMFVIPWDTHTLIGTTDTDHAGGPDVAPTVEASDVAYLLDSVNHYFPEAGLEPRDVVSAFAGLRPLVAPPPGAGESPSDVSREEEIFTSPGGLVTICGGKLTTYRLIAAKVVDRAVAVLRSHGERRPLGPSSTGDQPLPGGRVPPEAIAIELESHAGNGLGSAVLGHLARRYGDRAREVLSVVARDRTLATPILPALPDPRAEVVTAVESEFAMTLEDVLRRRTQVSLFDPEQGGGAAPEVASLMAPTLGWTGDAPTAAARRYVEATQAARRRWR
jgi:glycerol-3-phosphate dehydrogenase